MSESAPAPYRFRGFTAPTFTQVPDELFDELAPQLTEAELRVLLYIIRRTFGFKKDRDAISLSQLVSGITTRDGRVLDRGTGMSRPGVMRGVKGLIEKGVISADKMIAEDGVNQVNIYRLRFAGDPDEGVGNDVAYGGQPRFTGVGNDVAPQQTVSQHTVEQDLSKGPEPVFMVPAHERRVIENYIRDYAIELNDQAPIASSVTRATRAYARSGVSIEAFITAMQEAKATTQRVSGSIRTEAPAGSMTKPKMPYYFSVLESLLDVG